jgi:hypothetical protein
VGGGWTPPAVAFEQVQGRRQLIWRSWGRCENGRRPMMAV